MRTTDEEKAALKIIKTMSDIHLDVTDVGYHFALLGTKGDFLRLEEVLSSAQETANPANDKEKHYEQMIRLGRD
jgi:hypothetical protein